MLHRRSLLATAGLLATAPRVRAQAAWLPSRPVTLLVGFSPGGGTDLIARFLAPALQGSLGQPIAVENRPGASGTLAAAAGIRAAADGHTLFMTTVSASAVVPPLLTPPPFDIFRDQTPIVLAGISPMVAVVPPDSPASTLAEFIALAKARPGALNYASVGVATQQHLAAELLASAAGISMTHVPFRGTGQVVNEVLAGRIDIALDTFPTYYPHIRAGAVRALATTMPQRIEWLPNLPTIAESGFPGYACNTWYMLMGPPGLPVPIRDAWARAVNGVLADTAILARIRDAGFIPGGGDSAAAATLLREDAQRYAAAIKASGIKLE